MLYSNENYYTNALFHGKLLNECFVSSPPPVSARPWLFLSAITSSGYASEGLVYLLGVLGFEASKPACDQRFVYALVRAPFL